MMTRTGQRARPTSCGQRMRSRPAAPRACGARGCCQVAGGLEVAHSRRRPIRSVLALEDDALIDAVCGGTGLRERLAARSPSDLLASAADAGLEVLCRHSAGYPARLLDDTAPPAALFVRGGDDARARLARLVGDAARTPTARRRRSRSSARAAPLPKDWRSRARSVAAWRGRA